METQISPMLAVSDGNAAIDFYKAAFGAKLLWHLGNGHVVAGLSIEGAQFFPAHESPPHRTRSPGSAGFTTVRIEFFVDDPVAVHKRALAAGATEHSPVEEHQHTTRGPRPIKERLWIRSDICGLLGSSWSSTALESSA
jgi:PhnB protein